MSFKAILTRDVPIGQEFAPFGSLVGAERGLSQVEDPRTGWSWAEMTVEELSYQTFGAGCIVWDGFERWLKASEVRVGDVLLKYRFADAVVEHVRPGNQKPIQKITASTMSWFDANNGAFSPGDGSVEWYIQRSAPGIQKILIEGVVTTEKRGRCPHCESRRCPQTCVR